MQKDLIDMIVGRVRDVTRTTDSSVCCALTSETPLFGKEGVLDSAELVELILSLEADLQDAYGLTADLGEQLGASHTPVPLQTIGSLAAHIEQVLLEEI